ncbi:MAG: hypothetical protein V3U56_06850 [Syntrophobacteria bacterium]
MAVLPGVLGCRPLRRTIQVRLGTNTLRSAVGGFMKYPGSMIDSNERQNPCFQIPSPQTNRCGSHLFPATAGRAAPCLGWDGAQWHSEFLFFLALVRHSSISCLLWVRGYLQTTVIADSKLRGRENSLINT